MPESSCFHSTALTFFIRPFSFIPLCRSVRRQCCIFLFITTVDSANTCLHKAVSNYLIRVGYKYYEAINSSCIYEIFLLRERISYQSSNIISMLRLRFNEIEIRLMTFLYDEIINKHQVISRPLSETLCNTHNSNNLEITTNRPHSTFLGQQIVIKKK